MASRITKPAFRLDRASRQSVLRAARESGSSDFAFFPDTYNPIVYLVNTLLPPGCETRFGAEQVGRARKEIYRILLASISKFTPEDLSREGSDKMHILVQVLVSVVEREVPGYVVNDAVDPATIRVGHELAADAISVQDYVHGFSRRHCGACKRPYADLKCSCNDVWYCDQACAQMHWKAHRKNAKHVSYRQVTR